MIRNEPYKLETSHVILPAATPCNQSQYKAMPFFGGEEKKRNTTPKKQEIGGRRRRKKHQEEHQEEEQFSEAFSRGFHAYKKSNPTEI